MILYHGSYIEIQNPLIQYSRTNLDFGKGFYTTPIKDQAIKWATRFKRRKGKSIISIFELKEELNKDISIKKFEKCNKEWLDFVMNCRSGTNTEIYDIIIGSVADDKIFDTIELYQEGLIDKYTAIARLRYEKPNLQVCFCNQEIIDKYLSYIGSEEL